MAYGWEAQARAALILGDLDTAKRYLANAQALLPAVPEDDVGMIKPDLDELASKLD